MIFKRYVIPRWATNCYLIGDEQTKQIAVVDPGDHCGPLLQELDQNGYRVEQIVLTHGHFDHIMGVEELVERYRPKVAIHSADAQRIVDMNACFPGLEHNSFDSIPVDVTLQDGDQLDIGSTRWQVLHTPGHSAGSICLYTPGVLLSGDTLFQQSVGRTDFPFGSQNKLVASVRRLYELPEDTVVYPGHGFRTTIGEERRMNPLVRPL